MAGLGLLTGTGRSIQLHGQYLLSPFPPEKQLWVGLVLVHNLFRLGLHIMHDVHTTVWEVLT